MMENRLHSTRHGLQYSLQMLFRDIPLRGKRVLDIGGGAGQHTFYSAVSGAQMVTCLEPESAGAETNIAAKFEQLKESLGCPNVRFRATTFQDYQAEDGPFDIILLHNSINHLNEEKCIRLLNDPEARTIYREIFQKLFDFTTAGGHLIVCDCTRYNLFATFGLRSPLCPSIEWHKHQSPTFWTGMLAEVGFNEPNVSWSSYSRFGRWGHALMGNAVAAFFLTSHFRLVMRRHGR